ncbi:dsDNA nuclease domain-containing protein [Pantoea sp.]|uniref:dsDNA nuclease domain-containing protein n=1 Tax=Pantoea sp. TaxID=69393 RepID=UPI0031E017E9
MDIDTIMLEAFRDYEGDENGGTHAFRGFSFQVWWAVAEALTRYKSDEDYAVILEWQQDVAIINSSTSPDKIHFIQLKKNESSFSWTVPSLIKADTDNDDKSNTSPTKPQFKRATAKSLKNYSILSKLYFHRKRFDVCKNVRLEFISNSTFSYENDKVKVNNDEVLLHGLPVEVKEKITSSLIKQLGLPQDEAIDLKDFTLSKTNLPIDDSHLFVTGILSEMVEDGIFDFEITKPRSIVMLIAQYMTVKAGKKRFSNNFKELLEKGITRKDLLNCMRKFDGNRSSTVTEVGVVIDRLDRELAPFIMCEGMRNAVNNVCIELSNRTSLIWKCLESIKNIYQSNIDELSKLNKLHDIFSRIYIHYKKETLEEDDIFSDEIINCLIAMVIKNAKPVRDLQSVEISKE